MRRGLNAEIMVLLMHTAPSYPPILCLTVIMSKRKAPKENPNSEFCDFLIGML